jgi:hypothetical protein
MRIRNLSDSGSGIRDGKIRIWDPVCVSVFVRNSPLFSFAELAKSPFRVPGRESNPGLNGAEGKAHL